MISAMSEDGKESFMQREEEGEDDPRLELGLSLCMGIRFGKRAERARILTAQDLSSCADGSPTSASQIVGWPPIRAYRMNSLLVNISKAPRADDVNSAIADTKSLKNGRDDKVYEGTEVNATAEESRRVRFVKVYMDGVTIGRKVDLNAHSHYETLARALADMFLQRPDLNNLRGVGANVPLNRSSTSLLDNLSEFVLTYEDKEGDWMLAGDVPWGMFLTAVRRLKIMRTSEAKGLDSRCQERKAETSLASPALYRHQHTPKIHTSQGT